MSTKRKEPEEMELFRTEDYFVLLNSKSSLWCSRRTGEIEAKPCWELANCGDLECLGIFYGYIGKVELQADSCRLVLIRETSRVGQLPDSRTVLKIKSIAFVDPFMTSDSQTPGPDLKPCKKHKPGSFSLNFEAPQKAAFAKTWGQIKSATSSIKNTTQHAAALATYQVKAVSTRKDNKDKERFEKRILEELQRVFTDPECFYFCLGSPGSPNCDLTNSLQRLSDNSSTDDRFFWNKHMLKNVLELDNEFSKSWILPIIQGYVQIEKCSLEYSPNGNTRVESFGVTMISRRSRHRAGTRYKRRGLDESGKCANYVETEQIVSSGDHQVSLVQVRGSVPLYWSQPGFKYRPPPLIDKGEAETKVAFEKHLNEEISLYGPVCIVNLVEQTGKEKVLWEEFTQHVLQFDSDQITYATFDFHEHCRGMRFENVSLLVSKLEEVIQEMGFFWKDKQGVICKQKSVFRVNCMDCLDRTNVVQTAIAKSMLETQLVKLGLLPPEHSIPSSVKTIFQLLWANNGDVISKQYAGTNALKGDYTRTGERKITGLVKDGMNSANRYYLSRFKDAYRQATIDIMQGQSVSVDPESDAVDADLTATAEHVKLLIEDCKKILIPDSSLILGAWGLINADPVSGDPTETDVDTIFILTRDSYYVADYDDEIDEVTRLQQISLEDITMVELGPMPIPVHSPMQIFNKTKNKQGSHYCLRFRFKQYEKLGSHTFRSSNLRFFNNVAVVIKNEEEMIESLRAICDCMRVAIEMLPEPGVVDWAMDVPLSVKPTNPPSSLSPLDVLSPITRNVSESQLGSLKSVGSKALSNMTSTFSKIGSSFTPGRKSSISTKEPQKNDRKKMYKLILKNVLHHPAAASVKFGKLFRRHSHFVQFSRWPTKKDASSKFMSCENKIPRYHERKENLHIEFKLGDSSEEEDDVICGVSEDSFIPNVGIVMSQRLNSVDGDTTPSITVEGTEGRRVPPTTLQVRQEPVMKKRTLSRSSGEVDSEDGIKLDVKGDTIGKSSSERDLTLKGLPGSQSENALRSLRSAAKDVLTSPSAVLSPLGKLARGVQSLGQNLDPRRLKHQRGGGGGGQTVSAESQRVAQLWASSQCKSRLIAV